MAEMNAYLSLAENDYLFAKASMDAAVQLGNYNTSVGICAQAGEKYLKAVIELCFVEDGDAMSLLHSHNLRALLNKILTEYPMNVSSIECKWLGDFYFDARYPGDNFVVATKQDAEDCLVIVEKIKIDVERILADEKKRRSVVSGALKELSAFGDNVSGS